MDPVKDAQGNLIQEHEFYRHKSKQNIIFVEPTSHQLGYYFATNSYHPNIAASDCIKIQSDWFSNYTLITDPENYKHAGPDQEQVEGFIKLKLEEIFSNELDQFEDPLKKCLPRPEQTYLDNIKNSIGPGQASHL
jgi:hypothetical protein